MFRPRLAGYMCAGLLMLGLIGGCGRPPGAAGDNSSYNNSSNKNSSNAQSTSNQNSSNGGQALPFDRTPRSAGNSPSQSFVPSSVPSSVKLPDGTPIAVHLQSPLSSAAAHGGDIFSAILDEPVVVDGQTLVGSGSVAKGRVLEAKAAGRSVEPGYLRIVLVSLNLGGKQIMIYTSSIFAKGSVPERATGSGAGRPDKHRDRDIVLGTDRRLNFRLAQTVDIQ
jgi:hypothetical protein